MTGGRRTLFLEITDLQHADVLAQDTILLPGEGAPRIEPDRVPVELTAQAIRRLLEDARSLALGARDRILVAPLFLANVSRAGAGQGTEVVALGFQEALERAAATNRHIRLARFPKAYLAMDESAMVLDGLVDAGEKGWQQIADVYVWGTYYATSVWHQAQGKRGMERRLHVSLNVWDGVSEPLSLADSLIIPPVGPVSAEETSRMLGQLAHRVAALAGRRAAEGEPGRARRRIADSIVSAYVQMTGPAHPTLSPDDGAEFAQAVNMLETACFLDPDNAEAHALRITCRWGRWVDFQHDVKSEFWPKWRRSQAWGRFSDRFGMKGVKVELPFPYERQGIAEACLRSLEDVISLCPANFERPEDEPHGPMKEAQFHGFPKDIPNPVAAVWKAQLEAEHWKRLTQAAAVMGDDWTPAGRGPPSIPSTMVRALLCGGWPPEERLALLESIWPACVKCSQKYGPQWVLGAGPLGAEQEHLLAELCAEAGVPERAAQLLGRLKANQASAAPDQKPNRAPPPVSSMPSRTPPAMIPVPAWLDDLQGNFSLFRLSHPGVMPPVMKITLHEVRFPDHFEVKSVLQLGFVNDRLLVLAVDERSAPSSDPNPDLSAEPLARLGRLWTVSPDGRDLILYEPESLPGNVRSFLWESGRLWLAGESLGYFDPVARTFRKFGFDEGLTIKQPDHLACGGGRVFGSGIFRISMYDGATSRWSDLPLPSAILVTPSLLAGNRRSLCFAAGSVHLYDVAGGGWTRLAGIRPVECLLPVEAGYWFGGRWGLQFYDANKKVLRDWLVPSDFPGISIPLLKSRYPAGVRFPAKQLEDLDEQMQEALRTLARKRLRSLPVRAAEDRLDPLHLNWRVPGDISALAEDGDYLWVGAGSSLLLFHVPSSSWLACCRVDDRITSLAVAARSLWIGTAYGTPLLSQISKDEFFSIPTSNWTSMAITPAERQQLIRGMTIRDRAVYAFYAGNDGAVVELLGNRDPDKASLEEMFLLAFSYDSSGLDKPDLSRAWFERIINRHPDSPWARFARTAIIENAQNHDVRQHEEFLFTHFDRNRDGILDQHEKRVMEKDPEYQRHDRRWQQTLLDTQLQQVMERFDLNESGDLDRGELDALRKQALLLAEASPEMLAGRKLPLAPFMTRMLPAAPAIMNAHDVNHDGALDIAELRALARGLQKAP